jgi:hypothetical protein
MKSAKPKRNTKAGKTKKASETKPVKTAKRRQRVAERIEKIKFPSQFGEKNGINSVATCSEVR